MANKKGFKVGWRKAESLTQLGMFLQTKRLGLNLSQKQVSEKLGVKVSCYRDYEKGRCFPNLELIGKISDIFFYPVEEIKALIPEKKIMQPTTEVGKLVRFRREKLGLNLETFAQRLGVSKERARCIELNTVKLSRRSLFNLAKALELENFHFITSEEDARGKLGQVILNRRSELGISLRGLASRLGISYQAVSLVERGKTRLLDDKSIDKFSQALDINPGVLLLARGGRLRRKYKRKKALAETRATPLGRFMTQKRLELGLTQRQLAQLANINVGAVLGIEKKNSYPKIEILLEVLKALKCEVSSCKIKFVINNDEFEIPM